MKAAINESLSFSLSDRTELAKLVSILELASDPTIIFAVAPESGPQHPVVQELRSLLAVSDVDFQLHNFFYSDRSLDNFLDSLDETDQQTPQTGRKLVMAFGIEQLPLLCLVREMKQLNLSRELPFSRGLVLIFWLNKAEFLAEFRNRAPALWNRRYEVVIFQTRPTLNPLLYPYLEWLIAENSYLKIGGVMQVQHQRKSSAHLRGNVAPPLPSGDIFLERVYVSLQAERWQQGMETLERGQRELEAVTWQPDERKGKVLYFSRHGKLPDDFETCAMSTKIDLSQVVRENQYSVILGAPGAGKTTLLRYLALHFATANRDGQETVFCGYGQEELGNPLLPVFFHIADYAERLNQQPDLSLWDYLRQFYRPWAAHFQNQTETEARTEVAALLLEKICRGQCLMLLDGLDEVFDQDSRSLIVERINQFVEAFSANKFVITSRIAGYRDLHLSDRFSAFTIEDMGSERVQEFLSRWCRAIEEAQQPKAKPEQWQKAGDARSREILEAIQANEGVKRLTAKPLLLSILALIQHHGSHLPDRRVKLYELAVQRLIYKQGSWGNSLWERWDGRFGEEQVLPPSPSMKFLALLAYWIHQHKPSGLVTKAELAQVLAQNLAYLRDSDLESDLVRQVVEQFLRQVGETTGLFVERASGVYGFMHLTFEEYFAARFIADNGQNEILRLIHSHLHEPRWNEPILLALGYYSIYNPGQINQLVEQLFSNLEADELAISGDKSDIKNASSTDAIIVCSALQDKSATTCSHSELWLKDLLFAGRVLAEVEVSSSTRQKLIQKLVITFLDLDADLQDETTQQLLRSLRQVELFNTEGEVITRLKQAVSDPRLSELTQTKAQLAILYVACGKPGTVLVDCVIDIIDQLHSSLFIGIKELVAQLGQEMTPALESSRRDAHSDKANQQVLNFAIALSYIRATHYNKAIALLKGLIIRQYCDYSPFIFWALAVCYQATHEYAQALVYYRRAFEMFNVSPQKTAFLTLWRDWSICCQLQAEYEQSLECSSQRLTICQEVNRAEESQEVHQSEDWSEYERGVEFQQQCLMLDQNPENQLLVALNHYRLGRIYQAWGQYEQATEHYQHSCDLYQHLGRDKSAADTYYQLSRIYQAWGKYEQAVECQQQCLTIRQKLEDRVVVALSYYQLGHIYQSWGKYEQAIHSYHNSCNLYQQLGRDKNVADAYYQIGQIYHAWGNYEQAVNYQQQCLMLHQNSDNQVLVALNHYRLGRIYQDWGKYEPAIQSYQHSCNLYQQQGRDKDVADQCHWLASCYQAWGQPEQAIKYYQLSRELYQPLGLHKEVAYTYYRLGCIYQISDKYEQAIEYYQYSRELYQQLGLDEQVAIQLFWLANCYQMLGKYEQAVECQQQYLMLHQNLKNQVLVALGHYQLGCIYQSWGNYQQAIKYYQYSCDLYQQLGLDQNAADAYYQLGCIYQAWDKYEQALECQQQCLMLRQKLEDRPAEALGYYQLGRIYQALSKHERAIEYYQHSHNLYQQLGLEQNVANLWDWMANCYQAWGKYQQAVECQQQFLMLSHRIWY